MEKQGRCLAVDSFRLFFAFMVVLIHVPMTGSTYLSPIFRCAVPFFYMVTGYYIYSESPDFSSKLLKASRKWLLLWFKYFVILTLFSILIHYISKQVIQFDVSSLIEIIKGNGTAKSLDVVQIGNEQCGIYVLWFLLSGSYAMLFMSITARIWRRPVSYIFTAFIYLGCMILSVYGYHIERIFYLSIPFLVLGFLIRKYQSTIIKIGRIEFLLAILVLTYIEWYLRPNLGGVLLDSLLTTPILILVFFIILLRMKRINGSMLKITSLLGRSHSLTIYIFHRASYIILLLLLGEIIIPIAAPLCFLFVLTLSIIFDLLCRRLKKSL